jgi:DNA-packaging protein gp3
MKAYCRWPPPKFKDVETLQAAIGAYFQTPNRDDWTVTGLALALDTSRETLMNNEDRAEFFDAIKKARRWCTSSQMRPNTSD